MDSKAIDALILLKCLGRPLRVPTVCWLFSDMYSILDVEARQLLNELVAADKITVDNGGWIHVSD